MRRPAMSFFLKFPVLSAAIVGMTIPIFFGGCRATVTEAEASRTVSPASPYASPSDVASTGGSGPFTPVSPNGVPQSSTPNPSPLLPAFSPRLDESKKPNITAKAAILVDERGRVLFEKNADTRLPAASTQKLLLGILIVENGNLGQTVTIQDEDTWAEPTIIGFKVGDTYTRQELLQAVLVRSCNDIARALARDHSGSVSAFAANMNRRARQLGMNNSYFTNASGLPKPSGQYSTARDLAILGAAAMGKPFIRDAVRTKAVTFRLDNGTAKTLTNTNVLLRNRYYCTGAKTGYTNAAGKCLVSTGTANGRSVIAVILGSKTPTVWDESDALLRYGLDL